MRVWMTSALVWGRAQRYVDAVPDHAPDIHPLFYGAPKTTEFKKLRKRIAQQTMEAIETYGMIEDGPRPKWLVCL